MKSRDNCSQFCNVLPYWFIKVQVLYKMKLTLEGNVTV
jgi:hypothetical protein